MIESITQGMRKNVVALVAHGKVTHEDYQKVVIPILESKRKLHPKLRLFFRTAEDFTGYTTQAVWDDTKIGLKHMQDFEKIAVVTDVGWLAETIRFFRVFMPYPVTIFPDSEIAHAVEWINE
jgi:hypothetical protein